MHATPIPFETLHTLLSSLATAGFRYRLWYGEIPYTPQDLLVLLQSRHSPALGTRCETRVQVATIAGAQRSGWRIHVLASTTRAPDAHKPSLLFIEDLLAIEAVVAWLERQQPDQTLAVLRPQARASSFLDAYFEQALGLRTDEATWARLPIWYGGLEDLIAGLDTGGQQEQVVVCAATLLAWLDVIAALFADGRDGLCTLDDAEETWQEHALDQP